MRRTGSGSPATVFAHGLGGSIAQARAFGSGVSGSRTFFAFRGHDGSADADMPWDYAGLAGEVRAVADEAAATRAVGVSLGAAALLRVLVESPDRFDRVVLVLPAVLDEAVPDRFDRLARAGGVGELAALLLSEQPEGARDRSEVVRWAREQAERLDRPGLRRAVRQLAGQHPVRDRSELAGCRARALVLGQEGDPAHPDGLAREVVAALPAARGETLPPGGLLWTHRRRTRELIAGFLDE